MKIPFIFLFFLLNTPAKAQLKLPALFGDHMIIQRDKPVKIWGAAKPGDSIYLSIGRVRGSTIADIKGHWLITLQAFSTGASYVLSVKTKNESIVFSDILFGEVWLCSGQSNMQFRVNQSVNAEFDIHRADNPLIRQVEVPNKLSFQPEEFLDSARWIISTPKTTGEFTAVGYFFARDIYKRLHVPVGLIYDNWGGSQVESWISKDAMMGSVDLKEYAGHMSGNWDETNAGVEKRLGALLAKNNFGKNPDVEEEDIIKPGYSFSGWMPSAVPGDLDWIGLPAFRGEVYMMKEIMVDSIQTRLPSKLSLGINDIRLSFFLNGKPLPNTADNNILISIDPNTWKEGKNILLVKSGIQPMPGWGGIGLLGSVDQIFVDFAGERIPLADDKWKMIPILDHPHHFLPWMNSEGALIYNAMIHPIIPFSIRGVLWYQGEANTDRASEYGRTFPLMIQSWRKEWNDEFPFLFVQLSSFGTMLSSNAGNKWAELREAQTNTLSLPKTGMAVTTDIGDPKDIHPKNKQDVGRRLAAIALNNVYGIAQICNGPVYHGVRFSDGKAILSFTSIGKGLVAKNKYGELFGFEMAGTNRKFYYAQAIIHGNKIVVSTDSVLNPVAVRYGWNNAPIDINLYNLDGFPASPFRTDDWPRVTDSARFFMGPP